MRQAEQRLRVIKLLLLWQLAIAAAAGLIGMMMGEGGVSGALSGGFIAWLPNCYFAFRAFRYRGARAARQIVHSFYAGVAGKVLLTASLFILVFSTFNPLNAPAVFMGFLLVQMVSWVVPVLVSQRQIETTQMFTEDPRRNPDGMDDKDDVVADAAIHPSERS